MAKPSEIKRYRKLLPEETKELVDEQIAFMISRIGEVPDEELKKAWQVEIKKHTEEFAQLIYDIFQNFKNRTNERNS